MKKLVLTALMAFHFTTSADNKYQSFLELSKKETAGVDYRIEIQKKSSPFSILAIHGGNIEPTTSEITRAIAGSEFNYYLFEGIKKAGNWDLHISSFQFDEPGALKLVAESQACVSIHGFKNNLQQLVCLGGLNTNLKEKIFARLMKTGLLSQTSENPCRNYYASTKFNIVNRCQKFGVQIEVSKKLRDALRGKPDKMLIFGNAIRSAIFEYQKDLK